MGEIRQNYSNKMLESKEKTDLNEVLLYSKWIFYIYQNEVNWERLAFTM